MNARTRNMAIVLVIGLLIGAGTAYWMLRRDHGAGANSVSSGPPPATQPISVQLAAATQPVGSTAIAATQPANGSAGAAGASGTPQEAAPTPVPDSGPNSPDGSRVAFAGNPSGSAPAAAGSPSAESTPGSPTGSSIASNAAAAVSELARVVPNSDLKGRLGRLVVKFPDAAPCKDTHVRITRPQSDANVKAFYGSDSAEVTPGTYVVVVNNKPVPNLAVQSKSDTIVSVGVLHVSAGKDTHIDLLDSDGKKQLASGYGEQQWGLPPGKYFVRVAGASESVEIKADQVTEF
jgi:hypothetical protein